jgi:hypothetical protein
MELNMNYDTLQVPEQIIPAAAARNSVTAAELTQALAGAKFSAREVAPAVKAHFSMPALELGHLLRDAYHELGANDLDAALKAAQYSDAEVAAAVSTLYPLKLEGPAGKLSKHTFDDFVWANQQQQSLTKIIVRHGEIVDSIQSFIGSQRGSKWTPRHGGQGGTKEELVFKPGDVLVEISGYVGIWYKRQHILQLTLKTRQGEIYGPYGSMKSATRKEPFCFNTQSGEIVGFHGSYGPDPGSQEDYLTALGVVIKEGD